MECYYLCGPDTSSFPDPQRGGYFRYTEKKWRGSSVGYRSNTIQDLSVKIDIDLALDFP